MTPTLISDIFARRRNPVLSIEIFPPKTETGIENLKSKLHTFKKFSPEFISVTFGAGGGTRHNTLELARIIQDDYGIPSMSHLTCSGMNRSDTLAYLNKLKEFHVRNVMVLRGDPQQGQTQFQAEGDGFNYASELIGFIKKELTDLSLGCAAYPEGHVEADTLETDIDYLKRKLDAGASFIVTQFFLDNAYFLRFRDLLADRGINAPLMAGILPITNTAQMARFAFMCGVTIPAKVLRGLHGRSEEDQEKFGLDHAALQIEELLGEGISGVHLYALNRSHAVERLAPLVK